jgi:wyosine [tRNA(Phe)-imidazoG37] synthetase (radical SAM superfamily)
VPGEAFATTTAMPIPLHQRIVYGPVRSRRLGRSLGINLLPPHMKVCNMDCAYCQYGSNDLAGGTAASPDPRRRKWPAPPRVEAALSMRLRQAEKNGELIDRITISGHGEPTLHPAFEEIAERLCHARDRVAPRLKIAILSNSTTTVWPDVRRGLSLLDERYMKLDAGDALTYARLNASPISLGAVVDGLRSLPHVIIQSMFVTDEESVVDNTLDGPVNEWLDAIETIQPLGVHIYTLARPPAKRALRQPSPRRLREIAERVHALGIPAHVYN